MEIFTTIQPFQHFVGSRRPAVPEPAVYIEPFPEGLAGTVFEFLREVASRGRHDVFIQVASGDRAALGLALRRYEAGRPAWRDEFLCETVKALTSARAPSLFLVKRNLVLALLEAFADRPGTYFVMSSDDGGQIGPERFSTGKEARVFISRVYGKQAAGVSHLVGQDLCPWCDRTLEQCSDGDRCWEA